MCAELNSITVRDGPRAGTTRPDDTVQLITLCPYCWCRLSARAMNFSITRYWPSFENADRRRKEGTSHFINVAHLTRPLARVTRRGALFRPLASGMRQLLLAREWHFFGALDCDAPNG